MSYKPAKVILPKQTVKSVAERSYTKDNWGKEKRSAAEFDRGRARLFLAF